MCDATSHKKTSLLEDDCIAFDRCDVCNLTGPAYVLVPLAKMRRLFLHAPLKLRLCLRGIGPPLISCCLGGSAYLSCFERERGLPREEQLPCRGSEKSQEIPLFEEGDGRRSECGAETGSPRQRASGKLQPRLESTSLWNGCVWSQLGFFHSPCHVLREEIRVRGRRGEWR